MTLDVLVLSPHPDDGEMGCGGWLLLLKKKGYKTGILQMTQGEKGSQGNQDIRKSEMQACAKLLQLDYIQFAGFKDCQIEDNFENRLRISHYIRQLRPKIVILPHWEANPPGRHIGHTDHIITGMLGSHAVNLARLKKINLPEKEHEVQKVFYYLLPKGSEPDFLVDITKVAPQWIKALRCYRSQMFQDQNKKMGLLRTMIAESQVLGFAISARYAQGFLSPIPLKIQDPFLLLE